MHKLALLTLIAAVAAAVPAQNPCPPPANSPQSLSATPGTATGYVYYTRFGQNPAQVAPFLGSVSCLFDLTVAGGVNLNTLDYGDMFCDGNNYYAGPPPGPMCNLGTNNITSVPGPLGPTTFQLNIWTCPTSINGNETTWPGVWTQIGSAYASYTGPWYNRTTYTCGTGLGSPAPIFLAPGTYGVALEFVAVPGISCTQYTNVTTPFAPQQPMAWPPGGTPVHSDAYLTTQNFKWQRNSFLDVPLTNIATYAIDFNMALNYIVPPGSAWYSTFGGGCVENPKSFRDHFDAAGNPIDLSNSTIALLPNGPNAYDVTVFPGAPAWFTPVNNLNISAPPTNSSLDDGLYPVQNLPFVFPFANGAGTNAVTIGTNGILYLETSATTSAGGYYDGDNSWVAGVASMAPCFADLDTTNGASPSNPGRPYGVFFDIDPSNNQVYITWYTQDWIGAASPATYEFQVMLDSTGYAEYRYRGMNEDVNGAVILTGWTPGHGVHVPSLKDLDVVGSFTTGPDTSPISLAVVGRPYFGNTFNLVTHGVYPTAIAGASFLGFLPFNPGIQIPGAPTGCLIYGSADANVGSVFLPTDPMTIPVTVPNIPSLAGLVFAAQSALLDPIGLPGFPLPIESTNGACIGLGNQ